MNRTGYANLPLHDGKAPPWLTERMRKLSKEIASIFVEEYGTNAFLERLADPYWFQALGCVLGYDWHSSGVTTVVTGVLKAALSGEEHGIIVCGGKGKTSRKTPTEIEKAANNFTLSEEETESMIYASKMTAKVDNTAVQAGYQLYHHSFFLTEEGKWAVIQQGMNTTERYARRYHWLSGKTTNFTVEPHSAVVCDKTHPFVLNMTARESEESRKASVDLSKEPTKKLMRLAEQVLPPREPNQLPLQRWISGNVQTQTQLEFLDMPRNINWTALSEAYEVQPRNYEELLSLKGVGPATVRGLALVAELVYGEKPSWKDPVKYSFAYGGKDGVPYPVNRQAMDESVEILRNIVQSSKVGDHDKTRALQSLRRYVPENAEAS